MNEKIIIPSTRLKLWYKATENKMEKVDLIRYKSGFTVSLSTVLNWVNGKSEPTKEHHLTALEEVTGLTRNSMFERVTPELRN